MLTYDGISKKCHVIFKKFFAFLKVFKLLRVFEPSFKSINNSSLSKKMYGRGNFKPTTTSPSVITRSKYVGGNRVNWTYWATWYIELHFSNNAFYKLFYICVEQNLWFKELSRVLHFSPWFVVPFGVTALKETSANSDTM